MRLQTTTSIGTRLRVARERSGLTQQQLATALGLRHRQTVASIEADSRQLHAPELIAAMRILDVDLDFFTDPFRLVGEGQFSFRTNGNPDSQELDDFEDRAGRWIAMYRELAREEGLPMHWLGYKLNLSPRSAFEDGEASGEAAAALWKLGARPANRLREVMEDRLHILVLDVDTPPGISGAASRVSGLNCALVSRRETEGRRNFDLAHELFHLLTWDALPPERAVGSSERSHGKRWRIERLAENFAAAFLMPASIVTQVWEATAGLGDLHQRLNKVAGEMGVSSQACKWRLRNLSQLSKAETEAIDDRFLSAGHGAKRASDEVRPFSGEFVRCISRALDDGRLSVMRAAGVLGLSVRELEQLLHSYGQSPYFGIS